MESKMDIEDFTEFWENKKYSPMGAQREMVFETIRDLIAHLDSAADLTEQVAEECEKQCSEWGVDGEEATEATLQKAREVSREFLIKTDLKLFQADDSQNEDDALWIRAVKSLSLSPDQQRVVLLSTGHFVKDEEGKPRSLNVAEIAADLERAGDEISTLLENATKAIHSFFRKELGVPLKA